VETEAVAGPRAWRAVAAWLAVALLALVSQAVLAPWFARGAGGLGEAHWLWAVRDRTDTTPDAFFLVRDFDLPAVPGAARMVSFGDEEFSLFLNGEWVAAGRFRPGAPADVREVAGLLRPGPNRVVVELRSSHGLGGFAARLEDGEGRTLLLSDRHWQVHRLEQGLFRDGPPAGQPEPPLDWGTSPVGRWGRPEASPVQPPLGRPRAELAAPLFRRLPSEGWEATPPEARWWQPLGNRVVFDWGEPVEGFLALEFAPAEGGVKGLVVFGESLSDEARPRADRLFVLPTDRNHWYDVEPRRFRYATVVSLDPVLHAKVYLEPAGALPGSSPRGPLGIDPRPLRPPGEDELWRELEGLPGGARGEVGKGFAGLGSEAPG
jgi:hypothetical protein